MEFFPYIKIEEINFAFIFVLERMNRGENYRYACTFVTHSLL